MENREKSVKPEVWTNVGYSEAEIDFLSEELSRRGYRLFTEISDKAQIAYGQPPLDLISDNPGLKWVHLASAGYDRYDNDEFREEAGGRGLIVTNSSSVYDEPCAQHTVAMILSQARRLPLACRSQFFDQSWPMKRLRAESRLLNDQKVVLLGFGAIARRLVELLKPFGVRISALRRRPTGEEPVTIFPQSELKAYLADADHVVNILPGNSSTRRFVDPGLLESIKRGASFYNIGRGSTVDQEALLRALESGHLGAACLDVTDPEPLPPEHPLWSAPNCFITPHTAGGHIDETSRLIGHFLSNVDRFNSGQELNDRII